MKKPLHKEYISTKIFILYGNLMYSSNVLTMYFTESVFSQNALQNIELQKNTSFGDFGSLQWFQNWFFSGRSWSSGTRRSLPEPDHDCRETEENLSNYDLLGTHKQAVGGFESVIIVQQTDQL